MSELGEIKRILQKMLNKLELVYPDTNDKDATYADTVTSPASSVLTITFTFGAEWRLIVSKLYVDVVSGVTAVWYYKGKAVKGNEIEFVKKLLFTHPENVVLKITNSTATDTDLDILIEAFGRELGGE